jgi:hypothetical protein
MVRRARGRWSRLSEAATNAQTAHAESRRQDTTGEGGGRSCTRHRPADSFQPCRCRKPCRIAWVSSSTIASLDGCLGPKKVGRNAAMPAIMATVE